MTDNQFMPVVQAHKKFIQKISDFNKYQNKLYQKNFLTEHEKDQQKEKFSMYITNKKNRNVSLPHIENQFYIKKPKPQQQEVIQKTEIIQQKIYPPSPQLYFYSLGTGNNVDVVRRVMKKRSNWYEASNQLQQIHFKWAQSNINFDYNKKKTIYNHFPNHQELSLKSSLIINLTKVSEDSHNFIPLTFFDWELSKFKSYHQQLKSQSFWMLKPIDLNRGRGIKIFSDLQQLQKIIPQRNFIIQKYIENPLLIEGRKFDIRIWCLITHRKTSYYFKEGYIRTSCENFKMQDINNPYIHLTNNAIQKDSVKYSKFEDGNQLSFYQFARYLKDIGKSCNFEETILNDMKKIMKSAVQSVKNKLGGKSKNCFEIFGFDFMIDENLNVWLIEANTNPCIEESSGLLKRIIPQMLDEAFMLTLDQILDETLQINECEIKGWIRL